MLEAELKLLLCADDVPRLKSHPLPRQWSVKRPYTRALENRYYDTPDFALAAQGIALRVRRIGGRWRQTLKAGNTALAGLHTRGEWEMPIASPRLQWRKLLDALPAETDLRDRLQNAAGQGKLAPRVLTRFRRCLWNLRTPRGDVVEMALDQGEILAGGQTLPICEIELELKSGRIAALYDIALALGEELPLCFGSLGKAERGFALLQPKPWQAVGASPVPPGPHGTIQEALAATVMNALAQIEANEAGLREGGLPECLHQTRVGLRRLRAALKLFRGVAALPEKWLDEIRWAAGVLGPARDWDVLAETTLASLPDGHGDGHAPIRNVAHAPSPTPGTPQGASGEIPASRSDDRANAGTAPALAVLRAGVFAHAQARRQAALAALDPARHARWRMAVVAWVLECQPAEGAGDLAPWAQASIARLIKRLKKHARHLPQASAQERHAARIAAKQLRYALEFFASVLDAAATPRAVRALARLQDALGSLNDAVVAERLLQELALARPELAADAAWARGWLAAQASGELIAIGAQWRPVAKALRRLPGRD